MCIRDSQWTDWLPNADFSEAILAGTFDWNGPKMPTPFATENDTCNGVSMLLGTLVSNTAPCFHDAVSYTHLDVYKRQVYCFADKIVEERRRR